MSEPAWNPYDRNCPSRGLLDRISSRWTILIVGVLAEGPSRFSDIARRVDGLSEKMLTQTLRQLEEDGLVSRTVTPSVPVRVDYELTTDGRTLIAPLHALEDWVVTHMSQVDQARHSAREARA
ncbi:winged helix-turn-helix transcriptional regulator [Demequina zhanjiangensis]|uniref:Helix-turn-helix domain-containing protein n=1 Tax=Demequina zhanjiangensis TaxID=3051659 RepID=A0ABT8G4I5_9MICO|nr:helix-turn-helix domain-containing protein [Demequina sp. SYSU T00b26]MDN4474045.1 helix-turn-helix domain-containing protein [Demequina sp. SYSU T00b26]